MPFSCTVTHDIPTDNVEVQVVAAKVSGLYSDQLTTTVQQIKTVYFTSYLNPNPYFEGINGEVDIFLNNTNGDITCNFGILPGRKLI